MRIGIVAVLSALAVLGLWIPARAANGDAPDKQTSDIEILGEFDIIIGDLGDRYDGWDSCETRVWVEVHDGWRYHEHYFDNLPAMMFVLQQKYDRVRITDLGVPEYAGYRHEWHGHEGHGLIDGRQAWYVWDYGHYSRGDTPLVLAFYYYDDAWDEALRRDADVLDYAEAMWRLDQWVERARSRVYWRGNDRGRWHDNSRWNKAWDARWKDSRWDRRDGWSGVTFRLGDFTFRWEGVRDRGKRHDERYDRSRSRGRRDNDRSRFDRDRDRQQDRDREREHGKQRNRRR